MMLKSFFEIFVSKDWRFYSSAILAIKKLLQKAYPAPLRLHFNHIVRLVDDVLILFTRSMLSRVPRNKLMTLVNMRSPSHDGEQANL